MTQKYKITCRCGCGSEFKKITTNRKYSELADDSPELKILMSKIKCPACKKADLDRRLRIGDGAVSDNDIVEQPDIISVDKYSCNSCSKTIRFYKEKEGDCLSHCQHCGSQDVKYLGHTTSGIISKSSQNMIKALDVTAKMTMDTFKMGDLNLNSNMRPGDSCAPKLPPRQQEAVNNFFSGGGMSNANKIGAKAIAGAYRDPNNAVANLHRSRKAPKFNLIDTPPVKIKSGRPVSSYDNLLQKH